jgi:hypothetical protein
MEVHGETTRGIGDAIKGTVTPFHGAPIPSELRFYLNAFENS